MGTPLRVILASLDQGLATGAPTTLADHAEAMVRPEGQRRRQSLLGRQLARQLLPAGDWRIERKDDGRPMVVGAMGESGPDLSITHSGSWVGAAAADSGRVGIDMETRRPGRDFSAMAEAYLSAKECRWIAAEGEDAFLAFWTMREAVAKAVGGGVALALALDGAALPGMRHGSGRITAAGRCWGLVHRHWGEFHLALAWSPAEGSADETVMAEALNRACSNIHPAT